MKKLIALLLALMMVLSLAACGNGDETPTTEPNTPTAPAQTKPQESTQAPTEAEPVGELTETARWSLRYDPEIWAWEDEDALDDGDYRSRLTMIIPDPEDKEEELVWFRINAMEVDHENFRSNLRRDGFDQYEYIVNNAYETVAVGGLDFLLDDSDEDYHLYFTRIVSAGVDVEIEISGDTSHQAVADVLATLNFTIEEGDNVDPPWYWEGTPYAVEPGSVVVGTYTLNSTQIPFAESIVTYETFNHNVAAVGETVYIFSSGVPYSYSYDGTTLTLLQQHDLGKTYDTVEPAADGTVWCSYLGSPLINWNGSEILASYEGVKNVAIHPNGKWGVGWFTGSNPLKLTFADGVMTTEEVALPEVKSLSHVVIDENGYLYACGSSASDNKHRVFVYNENMELQATLQDGDGGGLGSVTFATSTDNGFLLVDGNMREILLYTKDGTYIGVCKLNELCGTGYPWPCDATVTEDGSILVIMTDERQDESADELIAFKISGF